MSSIFSVQNLQTFLRRKNLRPPPSRGGPPGPRPDPPNRGRSPPGLGPDSVRGADCSGAFVSSAITLLFARLCHRRSQTCRFKFPFAFISSKARNLLPLFLCRSRSFCRRSRWGFRRRCCCWLRAHLLLRLAQLLDLV